MLLFLYFGGIKVKTNYVLTQEQQAFAADHHNLVYAFLNDYHLAEDDFYDVAIFGYLRAVKNYFKRAELRQYAFSTIAWHCMKSDVFNQFRRQRQLCRNAVTVSLDAISDDHPALADVFMVENQVIEAMDLSMLRAQLSAALPQEQADVLQLAADGYTLRDIASLWERPLRHIEALLAEAQLSARAACAV
jgi:RNA polymerase sigma factor (sigma-70 family)